MFRLVTKQTFRNVATSFKSANFATYKTSTGLVGLAVDPNGRENLNALANKVLSSIQRLPADSGYRVEVEQWYNYIKKVTTEKTDIRAIEDEIDLGQIEEVIQMAKNELNLIDYYHGTLLVSRLLRFLLLRLYLSLHRT